MGIYIISGIAVVLLLICAEKAYHKRQQGIKYIRRKYVSTYIINDLTQRTFTKAINTAKDLVKRRNVDIEIIYNNQVIFNGYIDITDDGNNAPCFWYNKKVLDENNIKY